MPRKAWAGSRGSSTLPSDWPLRRARRRDMAGGRCECAGDCGQHDGRCTSPGSECDHHDDDPHNHAIENLRWLCSPCHLPKTLEKAQEARRASLQRLQHPSTRSGSPGLIDPGPSTPPPAP